MKSEDIIQMKFSHDLFERSLDYALISWPVTFNRLGKSNPYKRIQKILIGIIAENVFENYLIDSKISYGKQGKTKWYEEDRYDIDIGKYAVDVKSSFLDLDSPFIQDKSSNLFDDKFSWFTKCHALVPLDQFNPGANEKRSHNRDKIYVFPFIEGTFRFSQSGHNLIHAFWDYKWLKKAPFKNDPHLGKLSIKYHGALNSSSIQIIGTTDKNKSCIETISFDSPNTISSNSFFQVFTIRWLGPKPIGDLHIISNNLNLEEIIKPDLNFLLQKSTNGIWPIHNNWQNLTIYDCTIFLLGWIHDERLRIVGKKFPRFCKITGQYQDTLIENWGCSIYELEPLSSLIKVQNERK